MDRYRFDRIGNVVLDRRRPGATVNTDEYRTGDLLFRPRHSSPSRLQYREDRATRRLFQRNT